MLTQFELGSAQRIARVVRAVEQEPRRAKPLSFAPIETPTKNKAVRVCTFTGSWDKNTDKTLEFKDQTATVVATNLLLNVPSPCEGGGEQYAVIAKDGTAWYYVAHESPCNGMPARELGDNALCSSDLADVFDAGVNAPQLLLNNKGCGKWMGLSQREVVTDVRFEGGKIVMTKEIMFVLVENETEADIDIATCDQLSGNITGGTVTVAGGLGSGTVTIAGDCQSGRQVNISISLNTDSCPAP